MGAAAMLLGVPDPDPDCLALIRPVYSGGSWVLSDVSPARRSVSSLSITIGGEGTGPWGGTSRALIDSVAASRCFIVGGTAFGAVKSGACWFYPTSVGDAKGRTFFKIGREFSARPYVGMGYFPAQAPNATTHVRLWAYCAESSAENPYVIATSTAIYPLNAWVFCGIKLPTTPPGPVELWANGAQIATTARTTPALGQSDASFAVGNYWLEGTYDAVGRYAEAGIWSVDRDWSVIPTGPFTV